MSFHFFFLGPSYKRGPPKGYIHAIEQRWHQVESLLGALMQCNDPRVQSIVTDLRQDDLAREILGRVDSGPYVRVSSAPAEPTLNVCRVLPVAGTNVQEQPKRTFLRLS